jgi:hypothetical protein
MEACGEPWVIVVEKLLTVGKTTRGRMIAAHSYTSRDTVRGTVGIAFALLMVLLTVQFGSGAYPWYLPLLTGLLALWSLLDGVRSFLTKRFEVDAHGLRFSTGGRTRFDVAWSDVRAIHHVKPRSEYRRVEDRGEAVISARW